MRVGFPTAQHRKPAPAPLGSRAPPFVWGLFICVLMSSSHTSVGRESPKVGARSGLFSGSVQAQDSRGLS